MSAKYYFPDSFSCRFPQILPNGNTATAPVRVALETAVVVPEVLVVVMMMMIPEGEEGAVMQQGGVPSLPSAVTTHRSAYNSALQNDLSKKMSAFGCGEAKTSKVSDFQWRGRGSIQ